MGAENPADAGPPSASQSGSLAVDQRTAAVVLKPRALGDVRGLDNSTRPREIRRSLALQHLNDSISAFRRPNLAVEKEDGFIDTDNDGIANHWEGTGIPLANSTRTVELDLKPA